MFINIVWYILLLNSRRTRDKSEMWKSLCFTWQILTINPNFRKEQQKRHYVTDDLTLSIDIWLYIKPATVYLHNAMLFKKGWHWIIVRVRQGKNGHKLTAKILHQVPQWQKTRLKLRWTRSNNLSYLKYCDVHSRPREKKCRAGTVHQLIGFWDVAALRKWRHMNLSLQGLSGLNYFRKSCRFTGKVWLWYFDWRLQGQKKYTQIKTYACIIRNKKE